jgi:hypothetical protein
MSSSPEPDRKDKVLEPVAGEEGNRHVLEHDKVSFVSEDQDEGVTRIEALCEYYST